MIIIQRIQESDDIKTSTGLNLQTNAAQELSTPSVPAINAHANSRSGISSFESKDSNNTNTDGKIFVNGNNVLFNLSLRNHLQSELILLLLCR